MDGRASWSCFSGSPKFDLAQPHNSSSSSSSSVVGNTKAQFAGVAQQHSQDWRKNKCKNHIRTCKTSIYPSWRTHGVLYLTTHKPFRYTAFQKILTEICEALFMFKPSPVLLHTSRYLRLHFISPPGRKNCPPSIRARPDQLSQFAHPILQSKRQESRSAARPETWYLLVTSAKFTPRGQEPK